jgi:hypothetical protein
MVPLIAPLLQVVGPTVIKGLISGVEKLFGAKTGPDKLAAVIDALKPIVAKLATAGKLPGIADDPTLQTVVETVLQGMKDSGEMDSVSGSKIPPGHQLIIIPPGAKVITIEFATTAGAES